MLQLHYAKCTDESKYMLSGKKIDTCRGGNSFELFKWHIYMIFTFCVRDVSKKNWLTSIVFLICTSVSFALYMAHQMFVVGADSQYHHMNFCIKFSCCTMEKNLCSVVYEGICESYETVKSTCAKFLKEHLEQLLYLQSRK
jgi:hypothetical protein